MWGFVLNTGWSYARTAQKFDRWLSAGPTQTQVATSFIIRVVLHLRQYWSPLFLV